METYEFTIDAASTDIGTRLDKYLTEQIPDQSRSYIQKLLDDNFITVNGKSAKSNYKLRAGDTITVEIPEAEELDIEPENIPLDIVYEDDDIIVINKPKGMVVHPAPGHTSGTLVNALMYHCKDSLSSINGVLRPGIVHRIDMDTTGLLVACKSDQAHRGTINKPITRHKTDRKKMAIDPNGRHAVTHYRVIERLKQNFSLVECELETGRTHQIRVHMASINHPLLGDEVYGPKQKPFATQGQVLHAGVLGFDHPITGEYMEWHADLPDYFQEILKRLR